MTVMHSSGKARVQLVFPNKEVIKALGLDELVDCLIGNDAIHRLDQGKAAKALVETVKNNHILAGSGIKLEPSDQMAAAAACSPQKTQMAVMEQIEHSHGEANAAHRCSRRFMRHPHTSALARACRGHGHTEPHCTCDHRGNALQCFQGTAGVMGQPERHSAARCRGGWHPGSLLRDAAAHTIYGVHLDPEPEPDPAWFPLHTS